jgi:crotonobetainyl-CoA:carnitine CoA-transferase CaiB-like acyl-CoA transferase
VEREIASDTAAAWVQRISEHGAICEHVRDIEEAWADERLLARNLLADAAGAPAWATRIPLMSLARGRDGAERRIAPAPELGADTEAVAGELGIS